MTRAWIADVLPDQLADRYTARVLVPSWMMWTATGAAIAVALAAGARHVRGRGRRWPAIVALVVAGAVAFVMTNAARALIVRDMGAGIEVETMRVLGTPDNAAPSCRSTNTWVVNRSSRPVRVVRVEYGQPLVHGASAPAQQIAPGTACSTHEIDYLGPNDPPPARELLGGDEARLRSGSRTWLTW